jgi:hypothetical protein
MRNRMQNPIIKTLNIFAEDGSTNNLGRRESCIKTFWSRAQWQDIVYTVMNFALIKGRKFINKVKS